MLSHKIKSQSASMPKTVGYLFVVTVEVGHCRYEQLIDLVVVHQSSLVAQELSVD